MQVMMMVGETPKIKIESKDLDPDNITTKVEDEELIIRMKKSLFQDREVFVTVYFQSISEITSLADAEIQFEDPVIQDQFKIKATSGSHIKMALQTKKLEIEAYQGGQAQLKGKTDTLDAYVNTGGILSATDLTVQRAKLKLNTGGKGEITVEKSLRARVNTGANFSYYGKPEITDTNTSLGGTISAWDEK